MIRTWTATLGLALCLLTQPVTAGQLEDAYAAYERGEFETAIRLSRPLAEQGYAPAQRMLGSMYVVGHGVPRDFAEAAEWFRKAAEQSDVEEQHGLGNLYAMGKGVPQDYVEADNPSKLLG